MFLLMKRRIARRNVRAGVTSRRLRVLRAEAHKWFGDTAANYRGWSVDIRKLLRFSVVLRCPLDEAPNREPWKRLPAWWAHGAFRDKGRHYGAQYLAGRRAPPPPLSL